MSWHVEHSLADGVRKGREGEKEQSNSSILLALILPTRTSTIQELRTSAMSPSISTILM